MRRREFIALVGGAAVWPVALTAQQSGTIPRIGVLWHAGNAEAEAAFIGPLRQGFSDLGYIAGKNIVFEDRYSKQDPALFESFASELVRLKVDVLIANNIPGALALQRATSTIPIVFIGNPDPVGFKLVSSLGRPGGNITGVSSQAVDLVAKRVQLLKEAVPGLSHLALLINPATQYEEDRAVSEMKLAADKLQISVEPVLARAADELGRAFSVIAERHFDAVVVAQHAMYFAERKKIAEFALANRLPTMGPGDVFVDEGVLMYYGANWPAMMRQSASYVKRILSGEKPADIPVQQPTKIELVINLRTAKTLRLAIPTMLLARADKVIE